MLGLYLHLDGQPSGPYSVEQVRRMRAENTISPTTLVWHEGLAEWKTVATVLAALPASPARQLPSPPPLAANAAQTAPRRSGILGWQMVVLVVCGMGFIVFCVMAGLVVLVMGIRESTIRGVSEPSSEMVQNMGPIMQARTIAEMMLTYAQDHQGIYPTGKTSTEVFQKLIDGNYTTDPTVFYLDMPGKVRPTTRTLTSENVCFDVTSGLTVTSSGRLPVVFTTGYVVDYSPGSHFKENDGETTSLNGITVAYKNGVACFTPWPYPGVPPFFIEKDFDPKGGTFTQLTP